MMRLNQNDEMSLRAGFLESATKYPDNIALVLRGKSLTYAEVDNTARTWASAIVQELGRPAKQIGVFGHRSEVSYVGTIAALMAGAAFVPLNTTFPSARTAAMAREAQLDAIIADRGAVSQLPEVLSALPQTPVLCLPDSRPQDTSEVRAVKLHGCDIVGCAASKLPAIAAEDIAYLLFTSGSTGRPKGVPITHANVCHFLDYVDKRYEISPKDRFSQTFDQTFDLSVFDLFLPWHNGASVHAMANIELLAPSRFINEHELTVWFSVPSVVSQMRKRKSLIPGSLPTLKWSLFCGEPLSVTNAQAWQAAAPNSKVENLYGPTELTIACMLHRWSPCVSEAVALNGLVPIGRPFDNLVSMVVDERLNEVEGHSAGELCISGPQTSPGYWRAPDKTAERFVNLSTSGETHRFYRTGDKVKRLRTGDYAFLGRVDFQVKVLGYRVELGEIEAVLRRDTNVTEAVALGWPVVDGVAQGVVAFVSGTNPDKEVLLSAAKDSLPSYMVPQRVIVLNDMPMNANGKVDRNILQQLLQRPDSENVRF